MSTSSLRTICILTGVLIAFCIFTLHLHSKIESQNQELTSQVKHLKEELRQLKYNHSSHVEFHNGELKEYLDHVGQVTLMLDSDWDQVPNAYDRCPEALPEQDVNRDGCEDETYNIRWFFRKEYEADWDREYLVFEGYDEDQFYGVHWDVRDRWGNQFGVRCTLLDRWGHFIPVESDPLGNLTNEPSTRKLGKCHATDNVFNGYDPEED